MYSVKSYVYNALKNDSSLVGLLGSVSQILFNYPNSFEVLPLVTYQEINQANASQNYFDNKQRGAKTIIQIDVWCDYNISTTAIVNAIDTVMQNLYFNIDYSNDAPNTDDKIQHRVIKYSTVVNPNISGIT